MAKKQSELISIQKLANNSALKIQKMVNEANKQQMNFNASEAEKTRKYNTQEAATARAFNAQEAEISRKWQTEMSNSAHQREVADLKAAGLNPVLSANGGAQSYTSSSASASNASGSNASANIDNAAGAFGSIMGSLMNSMSAIKQTQMQADSAKRVASINAAASKYTADVSASSAKYVADMSYKTQMDKPQSSWAAIVDKYFGKDVVNEAKEFIKNLMPNGLEYGSSGGLKNYSIYRKLLEGLGIPMYKQTEYDYGSGSKKGHGRGAFFKLIFKAVAVRDPISIYELAKYQVNKPNITILNVNHKYTGVQR